MIVVGYHGERWLPECLRTLQQASRSILNLVLVDNGGNGDLRGLPLDAFDTRVLTAPRRLGFAEANNFALQHVPPQTRGVAFLNQDTLSQPGWIDACQETLDRHADIGALSPVLLTFDGTDFDPGFRDCVQGSPGFPIRPFASHRYPVFQECRQVTAAAMILRTEALLQAGPFDPIFGSYYEDYDLCRRIRDAGYRVGVCGTAFVQHYSGSSTTTTVAQRRRMRQIIRNRAILNIRLAGRARIPVLFGQFVRNFPRNLVRGLFNTASSQPPLVQIGAHADLLWLCHRLCSQDRDQAAWRSYLKSLGWPESPVAALAGQSLAGAAQKETA